MFKLNCSLVGSIKKLCCSSRGAAGVQRAVGTRSAGQQEPTAAAGGAKEPAKDFSLYAPLPGQESSLRWAGHKFDQLPIAHIKATYNNTHVQVTDSAGLSLVRTSCGTEGFKNIKKSTPIAAQTAGHSAAMKAVAKGVTYVRVMVKGLGPGRLSAIKGLSMGGIEVVSITDNTPVPHNGCRPRKARRI
ncbi:28S ribosomal protein S11, mitochondrial [Gadus chalcogrammus]|uniref:28S ribosomal protein S11, mitochondrial n=1 Tax=Gadus chalcogrammus TaxID=1042646 RepID=UPI0024C4BCC0|nr:28S ribosomal protein S11, mitochondrial [Gadus chalcogrammus]